MGARGNPANRENHEIASSAAVEVRGRSARSSKSHYPRVIIFNSFSRRIISRRINTSADPFVFSFSLLVFSLSLSLTRSRAEDQQGIRS